METEEKNAELLQTVSMHEQNSDVKTNFAKNSLEHESKIEIQNELQLARKKICALQAEMARMWITEKSSHKDVEIKRLQEELDESEAKYNKVRVLFKKMFMMYFFFVIWLIPSNYLNERLKFNKSCL